MQYTHSALAVHACQCAYDFRQYCNTNICRKNTEHAVCLSVFHYINPSSVTKDTKYLLIFLYPGFSTLGEMDNVLFVGPIAPATYLLTPVKCNTEEINKYLTWKLLLVEVIPPA